ncbi:hypothetical protein BH10BAC5_BH10BAC5_14600 [soil metagenome]
MEKFNFKKLTKFNFPLHYQIFAGMLLGILFGYLFKIDPALLKITCDNNVLIVKEWKSLNITVKDSVIKSFNEDGQNSILRYFEFNKKLPSNAYLSILYKTGESQMLGNITSISRESSVALAIKPIGELFIKLLNMIAVPLVLTSLICGAASLKTLNEIFKVGGKTLILFAFTNVFSVGFSQILANLINPGSYMDQGTKNQIISAYRDDIAEPIKSGTFDFISFLTDIVPKNPFKSLADGDFLQIVFIAVVIGLSLTLISAEKRKPVIEFFDGLTETLIKAVEKIIYIAPFAVFALIASTVAEFGFEILKTLAVYFATVYFALIVITFIFYPSIVKIFTNVGYREFFTKQKQIFAVAFSTSSSSATLPVTYEVCEKKFRIPNSITSFILPLGTTINKDGTALYQAISAIFIAQVYGIHLDLAAQFTIFITCVITGAATAPVAGAGIIMLVVVLKAANLPLEGIALILGVDRLLNMARAVTNVVGDVVAGLVVSSSEGVLPNDRREI